jgi:serine/threonine-protein kinase
MSQNSSSAVLMREISSETSYTPVVSSSGMSYRPFLELGEGGMAKVFLARAIGPSGFNKLVVLKVMRASDLEDDAIRQMFVEEARLSARFNHPNLVQVQEINPTAEPPYLVMEYLDGKPLSGLRGRESITLGMRLCVISEVLTGLHHAHELCNFDGTPLGIVHRDISPHNVFVTYDGAVKVLDFGIAKMVTNSTRTEAGEVKGKLAYMAPEQMLGSGIDRRADIFSVGSLLWEAAVGRRMWDGLSEANLMHRLAVGEIPRPSEHGQVDPELEEIIVKATANNADERFATAQELQLELDRYIARAGEHHSIRQVGTELGVVFQDERRRNAELINRALRQSLPPPPGPAPAPTPTPISLEGEPAFAEIPSSSRAPWVVAGALVLLAAVGFLAPKFWRPPSAAEPSGRSWTNGSPALAGPETKTETTAAAVHELGQNPESPAAAQAQATDANPSPSASTTAKRGRVPIRHGGLAAPPRGSPSEPAPPNQAPPQAPPNQAPNQAEPQRCSPPYYFVSGIKTYKPECL